MAQRGIIPEATLRPRKAGWLRTLLILLVPGLMLLCIGHCTAHDHRARAAHQHPQHHGDHSSSEHAELPLLDYHRLKALTLSLPPPEARLLLVVAVLTLLMPLPQRPAQLRQRPLLPPPRWALEA